MIFHGGRVSLPNLRDVTFGLQCHLNMSKGENGNPQNDTKKLLRNEKRKDPSILPLHAAVVTVTTTITATTITSPLGFPREQWPDQRLQLSYIIILKSC